MSALDYGELLACADRAAHAGGDIARRYFGSHLQAAREKSPGDWVSEADLASEQAIRELLTRDSGLPVYGEEAGGDDFDTGWLVDPLDGTANFLHGFDAVGVSVGLIEEGVPVVGVVHAPMLDRTFCAARGVGAFRDERPLHVSARAPERAIVATGFPFRRKDLLPGYERMLAAALRGFEDLRRAGAASLDLCWTAEGVFDGFFELRLGPWDVAAGGPRRPDRDRRRDPARQRLRAPTARHAPMPPDERGCREASSRTPVCPPSPAASVASRTVGPTKAK